MPYSGRAVTAMTAMVAALSMLSAALSSPAGGFEPVTDEMLADPDPSDWLMWRRTLDAWGFSPLDQINADNVADLRMIWTRPLAEGSQEGTPLVYEGVMYFPHPGDVIQAIDARSGEVIWEYRRELPDDLGDYLPVYENNRNIAIYGNLIIANGADDYIYALNAETGELAWETKILDYWQGAKQSSGPIIASGLAITGRSCEPEGGPDACVVTAHDALTGREAWRTSLIARGDDPNTGSWGDVPEEERIHVGAWMIASYDAELNLIYMGTSVTAPAPKFMLGGNDKAHLYHNSTLAIDADSGEIVWHYQHMVDHWDLDHPFERMLVDTRVAPDPEEVAWINPDIDPERSYRVLTGVPGKTGIIYTLDRETGEFLWARPTIEQNVIDSIDGPTGKATLNPGVVFEEIGDSAQVCPSPSGGKNYMAGTYSPLTDTMFLPSQNTCATITAVEPDPEGSVYGIASRQYITPGMDNLGNIHAVNATTGKTVWTHEQRPGMQSLLSTGGGLLFMGDSHGRFRALDQRDGNTLWEMNLGSSVTGYPATFEVDGHQYLAVSTGRWLNDVYTPELVHGTQNSLYVFALPEAGIGHPGPRKDPVNPRGGVLNSMDPAGGGSLPEPTRSAAEGVYTQNQADQGRTVYQARCAQCHGNNHEGAPGSPPVAGGTFQANWHDETLGIFYAYLKDTMPTGDAGSLSDDDYLALIAYLLQVNGYPAGESALTGREDILNDIAID